MNRFDLGFTLLIFAFLGSILSAVWLTRDPEISRTYGEPRQEQREVHCTHAGFCMACGMSYSGKVDCNPRLRPNCPGRQPALVEVTPFTATLESGALRTGEEVKRLKVLGACR